ncbi:MAG: tRNA pseudouridine(38-40) synthase TruA [Cellulosilyticaceae bacterium]
MRNIKIIVQYDGSRYKGWQAQVDNELTIQGKLEAVLTKMAEEEIEVIGAERTDVGVHAENYVANFKTECTLSTFLMQDYLDHYLPDDIAVKLVEEVEERFHSRYNVKAKTYTYTIRNNTTQNVFDRKYVYQTDQELDINKMKKAADMLVGKHDFQCFSSVKAGTKSTVREMRELDVEKQDDIITITMTANDFLWHMPRFVAGTLIAIGSGELQVNEIQVLLNENKKGDVTRLAKSKALKLMEVQY